MPDTTAGICRGVNLQAWRRLPNPMSLVVLTWQAPQAPRGTGTVSEQRSVTALPGRHTPDEGRVASIRQGCNRRRMIQLTRSFTSERRRGMAQQKIALIVALGTRVT
jgi:hypothetical protein